MATKNIAETSYADGRCVIRIIPLLSATGIHWVGVMRFCALRYIHVDFVFVAFIQDDRNSYPCRRVPIAYIAIRLPRTNRKRLTPQHVRTIFRTKIQINVAAHPLFPPPKIHVHMTYNKCQFFTNVFFRSVLIRFFSHI